ncbi:BsuBI/PstI family type II restriction endonuclease [Halomonas sp. SCS19]|uniref:BsuBI/PstI family type II restriction endonuclease n=1 Tax=Halomonas sp. SCS19 TaxID=2950870 RepID=UPI0032DE527F
MKVDKILLSDFLSPALLGSHRASMVAGFLNRYKLGLSPKDYEVLFFGLSDVMEPSCFIDEDALNNIGLHSSDVASLLGLVLLDRSNENLDSVAFNKVDGVVNENKKKLLDESLRLCRLGRNLITVFSDRHDYAEVADQVAWGTKVWIANEPDHMIHYDDKPVIQAR